MATGFEVRQVPLPYVSKLDERPHDRIDLVDIHCTELPDLDSARTFGERVVYTASGTGNSGHYYVDRDGAVEQWVPPNRVAHHTRGFNERSIGIELVNRGRYPNWFHSEQQRMSEPYPPAQVQSLVGLIHQLQGELANLHWIAGHEFLDTGSVQASNAPDLRVKRKRDPGPLFPWDTVLASIALRRFEPVGTST